ncbi:MAG: hypothetical protein H6597_05110 [Flavobacteriales bacterium]|nr:hypothetical protein [Flavobacteriales bacterium]MCB9193893.1 hypothetical protein [Flavobacteriales bacterium]
MVHTSIICAGLLFASAAGAQGVFPDLAGETADGRTIHIPGDVHADFTVVGLAFSRKAQPMLEEWAEPAYRRFVAHHGLFAESYQADVWFIPMFVGMNKNAYQPSLRKFRDSADPDVADHVLFFQGELDPFIGPLELSDKDAPYFFVLDAHGTILHAEHGLFTVDKLDALEEVMLR